MAKESVLIKTFGGTPFIRVLDFLLCEMIYFDYSLSDIAKYSAVSWGTIHSILPRLKAMNLIKETRKVGMAKMYKANTKSKTFQKLREFDLALSEYSTGLSANKSEASPRKILAQGTSL